MELVRSLRDSGVLVKELDTFPVGHAEVDAILEVKADDSQARFALELKRRAPFPGELGQLATSRRKLEARGVPLLIVPFISPALGSALTRAGWSWGDTHGNFDLRAPGMVLRQRSTMSAPQAKQKTLPRGSGSFAIIRALIRSGDDEDHGASALAQQARVSQPRASQVLRQLHDLNLVDKVGYGRWRPRRGDLLEHFLAEYPGPGGSESYFYSLDAPMEVAASAARATARRHDLAVSADVGPDLIRPWRRPTMLIVYAKKTFEAAGLGLVEAQGRHDANVIVRMPADQSVFPVPDFILVLKGIEFPLADPAQMIWDLENLGGADRGEAAGKLRQWLMTSR